MPRIEEIVEKTAGAKIYTVLDLHDAFLQVDLAEESRYLTCISTHMGYYISTKLPYGISAAPLIFQEKMDQLLEGIECVASYQDDILIAAPTRQMHDKALKQAQERLQKHHFQVNESKSQIRQEAVKFLGFLLSNGKLIQID